MGLKTKGKKTVTYEVEDVAVTRAVVQLAPQPTVQAQIKTLRTGDLVGPQGQAVPREGMRQMVLRDADLAQAIIDLVEKAIDKAAQDADKS